MNFKPIFETGHCRCIFHVCRQLIPVLHFSVGEKLLSYFQSGHPWSYVKQVCQFSPHRFWLAVQISYLWLASAPFRDTPCLLYTMVTMQLWKIPGGASHTAYTGAEICWGSRWTRCHPCLGFHPSWLERYSLSTVWNDGCWSNNERQVWLGSRVKDWMRDFSIGKFFANFLPNQWRISYFLFH